MLAPKKMKRNPDSELCMLEFSTLFRIEQISDKLVSMIKAELEKSDMDQEKKLKDKKTNILAKTRSIISKKL